MAQQIIDVGTTPNQNSADTIREGFQKCNHNFTELYTDSASGFVTNAQLNGYFASPTTNAGFIASAWRTALGVYSSSQVNGFFADPSSNGSFSASAWRTDLGLGTMALQNANAVAITGGTVAWSTLTGKPTTIAGYGITDAYTKTEDNSFFADPTNNPSFDVTTWQAALGGIPFVSPAPASGNDFSMFPGGIAPGSGFYFSADGSNLYSYLGGTDSAWKQSNRDLF